MAPGTLATLAALTPTEDLLHLTNFWEEGSRNTSPVERFELDKELFLINLRTARRGAAAGPSGMTSNHLSPLLESERDSAMFAEFAQSSHRVLRILGLGQLIALKKPDGRVRGNRGRRRVDAPGGKNNGETSHQRSSSRHFTFPIRHVNEIRVRVRGTRVANPHQDGRGCDNRVSGLELGHTTSSPRRRCSTDCSQLNGREQLLPFVRSFYGAPSTYLWEDEPLSCLPGC